MYSEPRQKTSDVTRAPAKPRMAIRALGNRLHNPVPPRMLHLRRKGGERGLGHPRRNGDGQLPILVPLLVTGSALPNPLSTLFRLGFGIRGGDHVSGITNRFFPSDHRQTVRHLIAWVGHGARDGAFDPGSECRCPTPFRIGFGIRGGDHGFRITGGFCQTSDRVGGPPPTLGFLLARERDRFKVARVSRIFTSQGAPSPDFRFRFCPYGYDGFRPDHVISDKQPAASAISNSRSRNQRAGHQKSKNSKGASRFKFDHKTAA